jgi:hypothetical protein
MGDRTVRLIVILTFALLTAPLAAAAQQGGKVYRIGCIPGGPPGAAPPPVGRVPPDAA